MVKQIQGVLLKLKKELELDINKEDKWLIKNLD